MTCRRDPAPLIRRRRPTGSSNDGVVETFAGDGAGFVTRDATAPVPAWRIRCEGSDVRTGELDGDGTSEIVATFAGERAGLDLSRGPVCPSGGGVAAWKVRRR